MIDGFSRYLTILPLENLKSTHVSSVLKSFFLSSQFRYSFFYSDRGTEFKGDSTKVLRDLSITHYHVDSEVKASIAERVILTIKNKIS